MSNRSQQQTVFWPTAKAYAVAMSLPCPIRMRGGQVDLKPGLHPFDKYIRTMVGMLGKEKAAQVLGIKDEYGYGDSQPIIDEAAYYEETGKLFPPGVTTREEAERLEKEKP